MNPCGQVFVRTYAFLSLGQILTSGMPRCVLCLVTAQAPPGSSDHGDSPGKNTGVGCHALFQGIFPTQGSNPGILHCRWILYHLSHQGSLMNGVGAFIKEISESSLSLSARTQVSTNQEVTPHQTRNLLALDPRLSGLQSYEK